MRIVVQRVSRASVEVEQQVRGSIGRGLLVLVGIEEADDREDVGWIAGKIVQLRIFPDEQGVMNKSCLETGGEILLISQFTLHALTKKGNRPSYIRAARPEIAIPLYEQLIQTLTTLSRKSIATGVFGADMQVSLINDGPVTIWMDSKNKE